MSRKSILLRDALNAFQRILESSQTTLSTTQLESIVWLTGLLEGEGCITWNKSHSATLSLQMNDRDVVEKAASILNSKVFGPYRHRSGDKLDFPHYRTQVHGSRAIAWLLTIYPYLGERRRKKAAEVVNTWIHHTIYERKAIGRGLSAQKLEIAT